SCFTCTTLCNKLAKSCRCTKRVAQFQTQNTSSWVSFGRVCTGWKGYTLEIGSCPLLAGTLDCICQHHKNPFPQYEDKNRPSPSHTHTHTHTHTHMNVPEKKIILPGSRTHTQVCWKNNHSAHTQPHPHTHPIS